MFQYARLVNTVLAVFLATAAAAQSPSPSCDNLSQVDFGACALPLGVGVINGTCQSISGCASPVPLFTTFQECQQSCATCEETSGIDFGDCEALLGVGIVDGTCQGISGCSSPVPLFATLSECEATCSPVNIEERSWSLIKRLYTTRD